MRLYLYPSLLFCSSSVAVATSYYYFFGVPFLEHNANSETLFSATSALAHHQLQQNNNFKDFSYALEVRDWIKKFSENNQAKTAFVKEVDTFVPVTVVAVAPPTNPGDNEQKKSSASSLSSSPTHFPVTVDINSFLENKKVPPTQLQVWRLGTESSTDFPALTKSAMLEEKNFPLHFSSADDEKKHNSALFASPILRLVVYLPKASTARVVSECTDPSRRKKWDSQYDEFWILQSCRSKKDSKNKNKKSVADHKNNENDKMWEQFSLEEEQSKNVVFSSSTSSSDEQVNISNNQIRNQAQALLNSEQYQKNILKPRLRNDEFQDFEFDYARWTFHRIYSKMTAAFGVKPRLSYMERVFGSTVVSTKEDGDFVIRCGVDCSLPLPASGEVTEINNNIGDNDDKNKSGQTISDQALDLSQKIAKNCAQIPKKTDVPVHSHFQELLVFPVPKGTKSEKVLQLAEAVGKDNLVDLVPFYKNDWLPQVLRERKNENYPASGLASHDGVMMSFTTVNSTGLLGYPRWFERNVQKIFSSHAMSNLMNSVHEMDLPPEKHGIAEKK